MIPAATLKNIISDSIKREFTAHERSIQIPLNLNKVISLLGTRRSGKTSVLYHQIAALRKTLPREQVLYVNFEDDRLYPLELPDMDALLTAYYDLYPAMREQKVHFFFDEIQEVPQWEKFIRRIYDQVDCRIFLIGSSSKFLSKEIATGLRGRTISFEVFPLSFREFLNFKEIPVEVHSSAGQSAMRNALEEYLVKGGFPEIVDVDWPIGRRIIQEFIDLIIYRDISERHNIQNQSLLKYLVKYLFVNLANPLSANKLYNDLKSQGFKVGRTTIYDYLSYLEDAFLVFQVSKFSRSVRQEAVNPKKLYGIDSGIKHVMSFGHDWGRLYENTVFLELRRHGLPIYYWKGKQEVDFYVEGKHLINVVYDLDSVQTRNREINGLLEAANALGLSTATLVSANVEEEVNENGVLIQIIPLWKWLLTFEPDL